MNDITDFPQNDLSITLLRRLREGDTAAGAELEKLYRVPLLRFANRYLDDIHRAEDAVQEVFANILASDVRPQSFRAWAYRIARNVCLNLLRTTGRRKDGQLLATALDVTWDRTGPLTAMVRGEDADNLGLLLERISEAQREVLVLRYLENLGREEIAQILDIPTTVVKSRLFEGINRLRQISS